LIRFQEDSKIEAFFVIKLHHQVLGLQESFHKYQTSH